MERKIGFVLALLLLFLTIPGFHAVQAKEIGCYSFDRWEDAQRYYLRHSKNTLDADRDGWACEELIGFQNLGAEKEKWRKKPGEPVPEKKASPKRSWFEQILYMIESFLD
ncbi:hypothetical protein [Thermoactinomyces sp. CICC 10523]|uniref:hypothetical protein n=1 Tax=Thermoactinomyces sp. CICC 10523 TaxID=2767428 RepID=UPI0018DC9243|nr:hypothetical protein [Thermoactinomyces sp. CICC 10523]MBH8599455.1 hypothetical protein [Thermoactinomyces sp. CICC 10523]